MIKDIEIAYPGFYGRRELSARARLRVYEEHDQLDMGTGNQVVIYSDPEGEYKGLSPTNGAERIATVAVASLGVAPGNVMFVEYYLANDIRGETFDTVRFPWIKGYAPWWVPALGPSPPMFATNVAWRLSSRAEVEALIGEVFK